MNRFVTAFVLLAAFVAYTEATSCSLSCHDFKSKCTTKADCSKGKWIKNCPKTCGSCTLCDYRTDLASHAASVEGLQSSLTQLSSDNSGTTAALTARIGALESLVNGLQSSGGTPFIQSGRMWFDQAKVDAIAQGSTDEVEWRIAFSKAYKDVPKFITSPAVMDLPSHVNLRVNTYVKDVDVHGFTLAVKIWADSFVYSFGVDWLAHGFAA